MGNYDRWSMKTSKQVAPAAARVVRYAAVCQLQDRCGKGGRRQERQEQGQRRQAYCTPRITLLGCKNRFDLPEEVPFDYASIAACIPGAMSAQAPKPEPQPRSQPEADILPSPQQEAKPVAQPQPAPLQESSEKNVLLSLGVPEKLAARMSASKVSCEELQGVVGKRGYFPEDMPIKDYPLTLWRAV